MVLIGMLVNAGFFVALDGRMSAIETRMSSLETRFQTMESKFDTRFDLVLGKVFKLVNRLTRLEGRLKH